ncbi:MAG: DUF3460 family protein [Proteobacteria bacterium]|nr:DUF3460 family protein [Pseudomonadota bacterium]HQR04800.1 DUF3460 family protein [Rhodocyclaceae bacterium]
MALYESEHTQFIREWMARHPEELQEQKEGRALWWDKAPCDLETRRREAESGVPTKAYYYDAN